MTDRRDDLLSDLCGELWEYTQRANTSTAEIEAILRPFLAAWDAAQPIKVPGPYDLAVTFGAAAVAQSVGRELNIAAAMQAAWAAVPEFYRARDWYVNEFAPMRMGYAASPPEGGATHDDDASGG